MAQWTKIWNQIVGDGINLNIDMQCVGFSQSKFEVVS